MCPVNRGIVVQEQDALSDLPAVIFLQNVLQLHQQRWLILRVHSLALWKIINEDDATLIPKNRGENFSSGFLHLKFWRGVSRYAAILFIVALSPDHSDTTKFRPWSPIATGSHLHRAEKIPNFVQTMFSISVLSFRGPLRGEIPHF